jgi:hypothetical protein
MTRGDSYVTHFDRRRLIGNDHWGVCGGLAVAAPTIVTSAACRGDAEQSCNEQSSA